MQIEYTLEQVEKDRLKSTNLAILDDLRLLYHYTEGYIALSCDDSGSRLEMRMTPVLDFANSLLHILNRMQKGETAVFEFTERAATISFYYSDDVFITTSFSEWTCQCSFAELQNSVIQFSQVLLDDLCASVPDLEANSVVQKAYQKLRELSQKDHSSL